MPQGFGCGETSVNRVSSALERSVGCLIPASSPSQDPGHVHVMCSDMVLTVSRITEILMIWAIGLPITVALTGGEIVTPRNQRAAQGDHLAAPLDDP